MLRRLKFLRLFIGIIPLLTWISAAGTTPDVKTHKAKNGQEYVLLRNVARCYGFEYSPGKDKTVTLKSKWSRLVFTENSRKCDYNGILVWLNEPVSIIRKRPAVSLEDLHFCIDPLLRPDVHLPDNGHQVILLDPGHGGNDDGAKSPGGTTEKKMVLDIAKRVRAKLANAGHRVHMTRSSDRYMTLEKRAEQIKKTNADIFLSIHMNSTGNKSAKGIETFILSLPGHLSTNDSDGKPGRSHRERHAGNKNNDANAVLAYHIHKNLMNQTTAADRGIKRARFVVLKKAECPAVLIECGFLSNPKEERQFKKSAHRQQIADAIAEGTLQYIDAVKRAKVAQP